MSNDVANTRPTTPVRWLQAPATLDAIDRAAPHGFNAERYRQAVLVLLKKNPKLAQCTVDSFAACAIECAQLGLYPGPMGHAYLIPRKGQCTLLPGYRGLLHAVRRAMPGAHVDAHHVYEGDAFELIVGERPRHQIKLSGRGASMGVYAVAILPNDPAPYFRWMPMEELVEFEAQHAPKGFSPWQTHRSEMQLKTVLRRLCKVLPQSDEMARMVALDEDPETSEADNVVIDATQEPHAGPVSDFGAWLAEASEALPGADGERRRAEVRASVNRGETDEQLRAKYGKLVRFLESQGVSYAPALEGETVKRLEAGA